MSHSPENCKNQHSQTVNQYQKRIDAVLNLPLHQYMGVRSIEASEGKSRVLLEVADSAINPASMLHGGVVYTLCDVAAYTALLSILPMDREAVTHNINVSIMRPVTYGSRVVFTAKVVKMGRTLCFIQAEASVDANVIATASVAKSIIDR